MQTSTLPSLEVDPSTSRTSPSEQLANSVVMAECTEAHNYQDYTSIFTYASIDDESNLFPVHALNPTTKAKNLPLHSLEGILAECSLLRFDYSMLLP